MSATSLFQRGDYSGALARLESARDGRRLAYRARCLYELGRDDEALHTIAQSVAAGPSIPFVHFSHALLLVDLGRAAEALAPLDAARTLDAENVLLDPYRGLCLAATETSAREGLELLEKTLMPVPPSLQARTCLALETMLGPGRETFVPFVLDGIPEPPDPPALDAFNKLLLLPGAMADRLRATVFGRAGHVEDALTRAEALHFAGDREGALAALRAAQGSSSDDRLVFSIAEHLIASGDPARVDEALQMLPERAPVKDDYFPAALRAAALFARGDAAGALRVLDAMLPLLTLDDADIHYLHGLCAMARGDPRRARRAFERCFSLEAPFIALRLVKAALGVVGRR
ncbi:MAG: tetratricopeptide repeat protein [Acidobacteriota bacterium]